MRSCARYLLALIVVLGMHVGMRAQSADPTKATFPQLKDITASTGIHFSHLATPEQRYIVESMSGGVALIDYNNDAWPDIYFTNAPSVAMTLAGKKAKGALYRNNHDGTFTDVTDAAGIGAPCWAMGAVVGDYNNDGWQDLLVTCFGGVVLYRNNRDGTFTDVTKEAGLSGDTAWATGAVFGDFDGSGRPGLFVAHYVKLNLDDLPQFGSAKTCQYHGVAVQCGPRGLKGSPDSLYRNNGDGTFTNISKASGVDDPAGFFGLSAVWSDLDGTGKPYLFVANDGEANYLYQSDGSGHFRDVAQDAGVAVNGDGFEQANMGIALGDYNHKGRVSIAVTHFSDEYTTLFRNDGNLNFADISAASGIAPPTRSFVGWGDAFVDLDNDGWQELFLVNGHVYPQVNATGAGIKYREPSILLRNNRDGTFTDLSQKAGSAIQTPQVSRGLAVGDLFNDGHMELVIENLEGAPMILRPEGVPTNRWIEFSLQGAGLNRLALNARVRLTAGDLVQTDEVRSGGSYLSQSDLRLHFGLGGHDHIDKLEIFWPSGKKEVVNLLAANRIYTIVESQGVFLPQDSLKDSAATQHTH